VESSIRENGRREFRSGGRRKSDQDRTTQSQIHWQAGRRKVKSRRQDDAKSNPTLSDAKSNSRMKKEKERKKRDTHLDLEEVEGSRTVAEGRGKIGIQVVFVCVQLII